MAKSAAMLKPNH